MTTPQPTTRYSAHALGPYIARERPIAEIERSRQDVRAIVTEDPDGIRDPQFVRIRACDVALIFDVYDRVFFVRRISTVLGDRPLAFRLARRATSRGGSLHRFRRPTPVPGEPPEWFEMTVSTSLLFDNLGAHRRTVSIGGHECVDRLDALQRIVEHEIIHLIEHVRWGDSSCARARFRWLVRAIFGPYGVGTRPGDAARACGRAGGGARTASRLRVRRNALRGHRQPRDEAGHGAGTASERRADERRPALPAVLRAARRVDGDMRHVGMACGNIKMAIG